VSTGKVSAPICTIVAGPNGTRKTTFASRYLPDRGNFINADEIAKHLPESAGKDIRAARLFFDEVKAFRARRENFAIESTLAGKSHLRLISALLSEGWRVDLYYLWIRAISVSIDRVAERVASGGHNILERTIINRYPRSISNFLCYYAPLCSAVYCLDNSGKTPNIIFMKVGEERSILRKKTYKLLEQIAECGK